MQEHGIKCGQRFALTHNLFPFVPVVAPQGDRLAPLFQQLTQIAVPVVSIAGGFCDAGKLSCAAHDMDAMLGPGYGSMKWFTEFGHLNRGDMLTSEQHRCHNEKKKFQRRV